ncbi:hypothetical protein H1C71_012263 [Ictidomys tridecemlineatus]|nr:hypothetical protein H1C71_012263 [Ictidomys tridecemlineatus]
MWPGHTGTAGGQGDWNGGSQGGVVGEEIREATRWSLCDLSFYCEGRVATEAGSRASRDLTNMLQGPLLCSPVESGWRVRTGGARPVRRLRPLRREVAAEAG